MSMSKGIVLLIGTTVAEVAGLFFWVQAADRDQVALGIALLTIGLLVERVVVLYGMRAIYGPVLPQQKIALTLITSGLLETAAWLIWLFLADSVNAYLALAVLFVLIHVMHCHQLGFLRRGIWPPYLTEPTVIAFSAIEALAGHFWLVYVRADAGLFTLDPVQTGALILFFGILLEHTVQGKYFGKEERPGRMLD